MQHCLLKGLPSEPRTTVRQRDSPVLQNSGATVPRWDIYKKYSKVMLSGCLGTDLLHHKLEHVKVFILSNGSLNI